MEKVTYQCTLLSDIILSSNSATEEAQEALDYIPGSKFLGIVANQFLKNSAPEANEEFTKLFLSDKVRFGNAYPLINNQASFPIPLCWYDDKNKKDPNIYQIHQVTNIKKRELIQKGTQLKQRRKGYFNLDFEELNEMNQNFYLKSAYDSENRRSEEGKMFGYYALAAGSTWQFDIEYDSNISIENLEKLLVVDTRFFCQPHFGGVAIRLHYCFGAFESANRFGFFGLAYGRLGSGLGCLARIERINYHSGFLSFVFHQHVLLLGITINDDTHGRHRSVQWLDGHLVHR